MAAPSTRTGTHARSVTAAKLAGARVSTGCRICADDTARLTVNALIVAGARNDLIFDQLAATGNGYPKKDIWNHRHVCLDNSAERAQDELLMQDRRIDFAELVKREATRKLRAGKLEVTATHGLQAQALIDKREDRAADRDLMLKLGRVFSGAVGYGPPADLVEGDYVDIEEGAVLPDFADGVESSEVRRIGPGTSDEEAVQA